jgi:glycosyltransferase involved in cell wall biosynthesis
VARHAGTGERPYVLFVGSLQLRKNLSSLREAVGALATAGYPHVLAIVANDPGPQFPSLSADAAAAELPGAPGRVVMIPRPGDVQLAALMAGTDAFCLPSLAEGFGLPALEAMACGAIVVVSDRGALPEVVGDAGIVVPPTPAAIEEALRRVLDGPDDLRPLRERAIARGGRRDWGDTARGWAEVLHLAASEQQPRARFWRRVARRGPTA